MTRHILDKIRDKIRADKYFITPHAFDEMLDDNLSIVDIENIILTGKITEIQKDFSTLEQKYKFIGKTTINIEAVVICKLDSIANEVIIITIFALK